MEEDIKVLEELIFQNEDLEELESTFDQFNIFTSLNIINQEIRHSNFLGWLIDPNETHEIGDYFTTELIKEVNYKANSLSLDSPTVFEIDSWNFDDIEVRREWRNIDLLLISDTYKHIWVIENKIRSGEGNNQLVRYKNTIEKEFVGYKANYIYLTIDGIESSHTQYIPLDYGTISGLITKLLRAKNGKIGPQIEIFINHYNEMLKRYIMEDSAVQNICRKIYKKHKRALDLIYEYKPDELSDIKDILIELISNNSDLILDDSNKPYIRFIPKNMDFIPLKGANWTNSKRILLFEFRNYKNGTQLCLIIGPGEQKIREDIYNLTSSNTKLFNKSNRKLTKQWFSVYINKNVLKKGETEDLELDELKDLLRKRFEVILKGDIPNIEIEIAKLKNTLTNIG